MYQFNEKTRPLSLRTTIGVMGPSNATPDQIESAEMIGSVIASRGFVLLTGGLGGAMAAASKGAKEAGGLVIGLSPTADKWDVNDFVDVAIPTAMGSGRNYMNILSWKSVV